MIYGFGLSVKAKTQLLKSTIKKLPTRFNNPWNLALQSKVTQSDTRKSEFPQVSTRSPGLRTPVANTDWARIPWHLLQFDHRRIHFLDRGFRIVDDLFRLRPAFGVLDDRCLAHVVFYYFTDLCHILSWFQVQSLGFVLTLNFELKTLNYCLKGIPIDFKSERASSSFRAVVIIEIFIPRVLSTLLKSISGKINCSRIPSV